MDLTFADKASQQMLKKSVDEKIETVWDRYEAQQPQCKFGTLGICCRHCNMGPCRINPSGKNRTGCKKFSNSKSNGLLPVTLYFADSCQYDSRGESAVSRKFSEKVGNIFAFRAFIL